MSAKPSTPNHALFYLALAAGVATFAARPATAAAEEEEGQTPEGQTASTASKDEEAEEEGEESAEAEEEKREQRKRSLEDRIKAVQRKVFLKRRRVELFPFFGLDLNDPFFQHLVVGGALGYHLADSFGLEARAGVVIASLKQNAIHIVPRAQEGAILENPLAFRFHGDINLNWTPFYGKMSVLGEGILHFDTYLTAGPGIFGTDDGAAGATRVNPALNVGIGQRYFLTEWLVARLELRDYMFMDTREGRSDIQNLLVLGFSVSGFFPTSFEYEFQ